MFLGGNLGKAIADKFEVSRVGDLLYGLTKASIGADILKCVVFRPIGLGTYHAIKATCLELVDLHPLDEMQKTFGEDSIWVYEIIRYTHTSIMIGEVTK